MSKRKKKTDKSALRKWSKWWSRLRHKRLIIFTTLLITPLLIYFELIPRVSSYIQTKNTPAEVRIAYDENTPSFMNNTDAEKILETSGVISQKIGRTVASVCYIQTNGGGGWTVSGYSQVCYVRVTVGYYTDESISQVADKLVLVSSWRGSFSRFHIDTYRNDCILSEYDTPFTVRYVYKNNEKSSEPDGEYLDYQGCGRPSEIQGVGSISVRTLPTLSIRHIETLKQADYDDSRNQIWIEKDHEYFDQPIVCQPTLIPILGSCDLSRSQPVQ